MKSALVLSIFLVAGNCHAQGWFPEGAIWQHEYWNVGAFIGYTRMVADADTLLGGEQARVLRRETVAAFVEPPHDWGISPLGPFIVHESNGLVRIWEDEHETFAVLYDMNALPGEQWPMALPYSFNACDTTSFVQVLDTGTVVLNDVPLRWLAVERNYILFGEPWFIEADTVIERIGYTTGYFAPHDACNAGVDGDDGRELRCYTDDVVSYKRIQPWSCESLLTVSEATAEQGVSFPKVRPFITGGEGNLGPAGPRFPSAGQGLPSTDRSHEKEQVHRTPDRQHPQAA